MEKGTARTLGFHFFGVFFGILSGCGAEGVNTRVAQKVPSNGVHRELPPVAVKLRNTHYYTIFEADYEDAPSVAVLDVHGATLASVSAGFYKDLLIEGTGKLKSGKVLNFSTRVDGNSRYEFSPNPWGNGVGHCALKPFHTIAVDKQVIPLGSTVYIDETRGMPLPDGTLHDGLWRADDIGSAIQQDRVDLYVGKRGWNTALSKFKINHLQALSVRIVELPNGESCAHH